MRTQGGQMTPAEYCKIRLEHTLQFTQQATRLIYLVNGAILAMLYFVVQLQQFPPKRPAVVIILMILAFINFMHAGIILRQASWYFVLDQELSTWLSSNFNRPSVNGAPCLGTHRLYALLHFGLALTLGLVAFVIWQYSDWP
jgi:hypothetical protein